MGLIDASAAYGESIELLVARSDGLGLTLARRFISSIKLTKSVLEEGRRLK